jgi:YVTN family beta-propeller protein
MNWLATVLVLGTILTLTVPAVPTLGSHPLNSSASHETKTVSRVTSIPEAPAASPSVAYTLDLCTNHLYSGNALPTDCIGNQPYGVAYDSGKGEVFVANSKNVSVISDASNSVVATIPVGTEPDGVAYDLSNGCVYVSNFDQGTISIITTGSAPSTNPTTNPTTGFLGLPGYDRYFLLIVIAAVVVAVVVIALTRRKKAGAAPPPSTGNQAYPQQPPPSPRQ